MSAPTGLGPASERQERFSVQAELLLAIIAALWAWWALSEGAFFGVDFYPGEAAVLALLILTLLVTPGGFSLSGPLRVAAVALAALAAWTLASALWTPAPDIALADFHRVLLYAAAVALGARVYGLLVRGGGSPLVALAPLAAAGGVVAAVTVVRIWLDADPGELLDASTLESPLGYRNANAAFFLICFWAAAAIAAHPGVRRTMQPLAAASAALALSLAILSQSRGSVFATVAALAVFVAASPYRLRSLAILGLIVAPVAFALPGLLEVFQADSAREGGEALESAALAASLAAAAAGALVAVAQGAAPRIRLSDRARTGIGASLAAVAAIGLAIGVAVFVSEEGDPVGFLNQRIEEFREGGNPDLDERGTRFGVNVASDRGDMWRVALDDFVDSPLLGAGAGGFRYSYLLGRDSNETPIDAHSLEVELLGELGVPGLALIVVALVALAIGAVGAAKLGGAAAALAGGALAAGTQWATHASIDWFWAVPAVTAPALALLGAAAAAAHLGPRRSPRKRAAAATGLILASLAVVPVYLSERYTQDAAKSWGIDLEGAYSSLERATDLNPLADEPLLVEAEIARRSDDPDRALAALTEAEERKPDEWTTYFFRARILAARDRAAARMALAEAQRLYPGGEELEPLAERLSRPAHDFAGGDG